MKLKIRKEKEKERGRGGGKSREREEEKQERGSLATFRFALNAVRPLGLRRKHANLGRLTQWIDITDTLAL